MAIKNTVIGSFPRSKETANYYYLKASRGWVDDEEQLASLVREDTYRHVKLQLAAGVDVISSGESSRPNFMSYVTERLTGFEGEHTPWVMRDMALYPEASYASYLAYKQGYESIRAPRVTKAIDYRGPEKIRQEIALFTEVLSSLGSDPRSAFLSVVSPDTVAHACEQAKDDPVYPDDESYLSTLETALRNDCLEIIKAGYGLQIDAPALLMDYGHARYDMDIPTYRQHVQLRIDMIKRMTDGIPAERLRMHCCWGNNLGPHSTDVALGAVLDLLLQLPGNGLCLEACSPGHRSDFLEFAQVSIPPQKIIYLGVIDPKTPQLESVGSILFQLREAEKVIGHDHLGACPNCGFETYAGISYVDEAIIAEKLRRMVAVARAFD